MNLANDDWKTPTQVQAERIAELEARLQLGNEACFFFMADRNRLATEIELMKRANEMEIPNFHLSDQDRAELRMRWYKDIVPHADIHERHFRQQTQNL
jgi:hypothetical protein